MHLSLATVKYYESWTVRERQNHFPASLPGATISITVQ